MRACYIVQIMEITFKDQHKERTLCRWLIRYTSLRLLFLPAVLLSGCVSPHITRLHRVLEHEIGRSRGAVPDYRCTVGAHRGASVVHRENTLSALLAAERDPMYAFVEFDVQFTRDRRIVLFHDKLLLRSYKRLKSVGNVTYDELVDLTGGDITLYEEAMDVISKPVNLEIKSQGDKEEDRQLVDAVIDDLYKRNRIRDVMLSSISSDVVSYIKQRYPEWQAGQIYWLTASTYLHWQFLTERLYERFSKTQADYLVLHVSNLRNIEDLLRLKPKGKTIMFWDFDDRMYLVHKDWTDRLWGDSFLLSCLMQ